MQTKCMQFIAYTVLSALLWSLWRIPMPFLFIISGICYFIIYHIMTPEFYFWTYRRFKHMNRYQANL